MKGRYSLILIILIFISWNSRSVFASEFNLVYSLQKNLEQFFQLNNQKLKCDCLVETAKFGTLVGPNGKEFQVSVVSKMQLMEIYESMAKREHIPFQFLEDGCYARAHEMARLLEAEGIIVGKTFLEGKLRLETKYHANGFIEWPFHVAPILLVEENGEKIIYVIDPPAFDKPVGLDDWVKAQTKHNSGEYSQLYQTNRFIYKPKYKNDQMDKFDQFDLVDTERTLKHYSGILKDRAN